MTYVTTEVEVEIDLGDLDIDDLLAEIKSRGIDIPEDYRIMELYDAYRMNQQEQFDKLLRDYFYDTIGRIAQ